MTPTRIATLLIALAFACLAAAFLTGCSTLGLTLQTDYGKFSYTLPELPKPTSSK